MKLGNPKRERGAALLALLAVIALAASWFLVRQLNVESGGMNAVRKNRNAEVLNRAKQALIGYVAAQAAKTGENRPGALPCPEAAADFNDPAGEGTISYPCTLPKVGRFPWRSLGLDKLVDASGEPLWYAVASGWAGANTVINSNCASAIAGMTCASPTGRLTVDAVTSDVVALIIAPGPAISASASAGCAAWSQTRPTTAPPDWRNYLECENATYPTPDATFVTTGPSSSFNDQVITIRTSEILPAIEAAIAHRIEREIAPLIRNAYSTGPWASTTVLPFAAAFADPSLTTTTFKGIAATYQGLIPLNYSETSPTSGIACTAGAAAPRCDPTFVAWTSATMSGASVYSPGCTTTASQINCTYYYICPLLGCASTSLSFTLVGSAANVGMALRQLNSATTMTNVDTAGRAVAGTLNSDGSAAITLNATTPAPASTPFVSVFNLLCGLILLDPTFGCLQSSFSVPITLLADHAILDSTSTGANVGWFLRNKWHEVAYYAIAAGIAPDGARSCVTGTTCLSVAYHRNNAGAVDAGAQRGIIILSGRTLTGAPRPNGTLSDWLEGANADGTSPFEIRSSNLLTNRSFNDHFAVIDSN